MINSFVREIFHKRGGFECELFYKKYILDSFSGARIEGTEEEVAGLSLFEVLPEPEPVLRA